jgi:hypothetical protein
MATILTPLFFVQSDPGTSQGSYQECRAMNMNVELVEEYSIFSGLIVTKFNELNNFEDTLS